VSKKGEATRERILDTAQSMVLDHGFSAVSIDKLIESLEVTKGAFFHHFKNKNELAVTLIERYAQMDMDFFYENLGRGEKLSNDPLQQLLIAIGLWEEYFADLEKPYPGCLLASYIYELKLFDDHTRKIINNVFLTWREELTKRITIIAEKYPPIESVHLPSLADQFIVLIEGAFILSKSLGETQIVAQQIQHYKKYLEMVFPVI
jgi:TetR/AcrR family transcriptional repressor of nem operon